MACKKKKKRKTYRRKKPGNGNGLNTALKTAVGGAIAVTVIRGVMS